jgi:hypothetical protein
VIFERVDTAETRGLLRGFCDALLLDEVLSGKLARVESAARAEAVARELSERGHPAGTIAVTEHGETKHYVGLLP